MSQSIEEIAAERDALAARCRYLEELIAPPAAQPRLPIRPMSRRLLAAFLETPDLSFDQIKAAASPRQSVVPEYVKVAMHGLRRDLKAIGLADDVQFESVYGWGYRLLDPERARAAVARAGVSE